MRSGWLRHHVSEANPERTALAVPTPTGRTHGLAHSFRVCEGWGTVWTQHYQAVIRQASQHGLPDKVNVSTLFHSTRG